VRGRILSPTSARTPVAVQQVFISMSPLPLERVYAYMHAYKHEEEEAVSPRPMLPSC
jgi:hypothetical protein